jgi:hypothetical protein
MYVSYVSSPTFSDVYNTNIVNQQFHGGRAKQAIDKKDAFGVSESLVESGLVQVAIQNSKSTLGRRCDEALFSFELGCKISPKSNLHHRSFKRISYMRTRMLPREKNHRVIEGTRAATKVSAHRARKGRDNG